MTYKFSMVCSRQENGAYLAVCPEVRGCFTQGDTFEEAAANLKDLVAATVREDELFSDGFGEFSGEAKIFQEFEINV